MVLQCRLIVSTRSLLLRVKCPERYSSTRHSNDRSPSCTVPIDALYFSCEDASAPARQLRAFVCNVHCRRNPPAVRRLVISVVIDPVDLQSVLISVCLCPRNKFGRRSEPLRAHTNPSSAVPGKLAPTGIAASAANSVQNVSEPYFVSSCGHGNAFDGLISVTPFCCDRPTREAGT